MPDARPATSSEAPDVPFLCVARGCEVSPHGLSVVGQPRPNIELFAPVEYTDGKATIAIGVDKIQEAKRVLADHLTVWAVAEPVHAGMTR